MKRVEAAPDTSALKLKVGQSIEPNHPLGAVRNISEAFNNLDRIAYYRRMILKDSNISAKLSKPHSDDFLIFFSTLQRDHPNFVQYTDFREKSVIVLQTPWMRLQLAELLRADNNKNLGTISDTTYSFFKSGFLLSSSIYNHVLRRWIPILLSFIGREDETHMKEHFKFLIKAVKDVIPKEKVGGALDEVVDFSAAQSKAFRSAYVDIGMEEKLGIDSKMSDGVKAAHIAELDSEARTHLKGCVFHYR